MSNVQHRTSNAEQKILGPRQKTKEANPRAPAKNMRVQAGGGMWKSSPATKKAGKLRYEYNWTPEQSPESPLRYEKGKSGV
jgi:hypothetical protein